MAVINGPVVIIPKVPMLRRKPSDWMEIGQSLDVKWNIAAKKPRHFYNFITKKVRSNDKKRPVILVEINKFDQTLPK